MLFKELLLRLRVRRISTESLGSATHAAGPLCVIAIVLVAVLMIPRTASTSSESPTQLITVKVQSGDTLWDYAKKYGDPNEYILKKVHRIADLNHMKAGTPLIPGMELKVPAAEKTMTAKAEE